MKHSMKRHRLALTLAVSVSSHAGTIVTYAADAQAVPADTELTLMLRHNDELLLEAIHRGDRATWARFTSSDFIYVEEGEVACREEFLKGLEDDGSKALIITDYEAMRIGDTVQVFHRDDVPQREGKESTKNSHLLMTETWQRVNNQWLLRIVHTDRIRLNPQPIALSIPAIDELVGTYRNADVIYVIERHGTQIVGGRQGKPFQQLYAETRDVIFQLGNVYVRKVFQRDAHGHATAFIDRDENSDRLWTRIIP